MRNRLDFYETPDWSVGALLEIWQPPAGPVAELCAGAFAIAAAIQKYAPLVGMDIPIIVTNDIDTSREQHFHGDATHPGWVKHIKDVTDFQSVITNPPYGRQGPKILQNALDNCGAVAMFLRNTMIEPCKNRRFLKEHPPSMVISLPRYSFKKTEKSNSDSSACAWFVWDTRMGDRQRIIQVFEEDIPGFYKSAEEGAKLAALKAS